MRISKYIGHALFLLLLQFLAILVALPACALSSQVSVNGNVIIVTVSGLTGSQCCAGATVDDPTFNGASCSVPCVAGGTYTINLGCNSVGTHVVYVFALDSSTNGYVVQSQSASVTDPPPPTCPQFDLNVAGTKVLTHQYNDAFGGTVPYPSGQTADGEIRISLKPRAAPAGTVIYLKVIDPPDGSLYGAPHQSDDNLDPHAGTLTGGGKTTSVTLPATGTVDATLKTTQYASGDNYQVEASSDPNLASDPNFVCDPANGCLTTPVITAWKRMYVEMDEMYRTSQLIAARSLIGDSVVYVNGRGFRKGDAVRLIHAPSTSRVEPQDVDGFYSEDRVVVDFSRNRNANQAGAYAVTLDVPLTRPYYTDGIVAGATPIGDAIVDLTKNTDPLHHFSDQYLATGYAASFVEIVKASSSGIGLPFYDAMTPDDMFTVGKKWFAARESAAVPSNFGMAVAGSARAPVGTGLSLGTTATTRYSYVWVDSIDAATSGPKSKYPLTSGLNAFIVSGEVLVHEVAHQWSVNPGYPDGHCDKKSYDGLQWCQMDSPQNTGTYGDGIIKFHYAGATEASADSEYITIRKTGEPKP